MNWALEHKEDLILIWIAVVGLARLVVNLLPVYPEGHKMVPVMKFIGKFIALSERIIEKRAKK